MADTIQNMTEVSKDEFFAHMGPLDVHPRNGSPDYTDWETPSRRLIGRSLPGWKYPGEEKRYFLAR